MSSRESRMSQPMVSACFALCAPLLSWSLAGLAQEPAEPAPAADSSTATTDPEAAPSGESEAEAAPAAEAADGALLDTAPEPLPTVPVAEAEPAQPKPADDATELDAIEVTATRRVKSQRDIPASINALRGEYLEKINAQGLKDYLKLVPGVSFITSGTQDRGIPIIRGIATSTVYGNTPLGVGVFIEILIDQGRAT